MSNHQVEHCFGWMRFNPTWNREIDIIDNLVAENERLQGLVGLESADLALDWNRLRSGDYRALNPEHQDVFDMVAAKQAEIERLREENSTFSDSLAAKADRIDRLGETVARQVAEIERLRELLRDSLIGCDPRWMTTDAGREWLLRVSEALGE